MVLVLPWMRDGSSILVRDYVRYLSMVAVEETQIILQHRLNVRRDVQREHHQDVKIAAT